MYFRDDSGSHDLGVEVMKTKAKRRKSKAKSKNKSSPSSSSNATKKISYKLHSNRVSELNISSTAADVMTALKRTQNTKDAADLRVISEFLLRGVSDSFAYGFKGSLLARLAVVSLRLEEYEIAQEVIIMRQKNGFFLDPFESAAIFRGLLRMHKTEEAFELLEKELYVNEDGVEANDNTLRITHRSRSLASIASRSFFENNPLVAYRACRLLAALAPVIQRAELTADDLDMPWVRILAGANHCMAGEHREDEEDLEAVVLDVMQVFPQDKYFQVVLDRHILLAE